MCPDRPHFVENSKNLDWTHIIQTGQFRRVDSLSPQRNLFFCGYQRINLAKVLWKANGQEIISFDNMFAGAWTNVGVLFRILKKINNLRRFIGVSDMKPISEP